MGLMLPFYTKGNCVQFDYDYHAFLYAADVYYINLSDSVIFSIMFLPRARCLVPGIGNIYLCMLWSIYAIMSRHLSVSLWCFSPQNFRFEKTKTDWTSCHGTSIYLQTKLSNDNHRDWVGLSNWFSLRCLGPWKNHLYLVWWSSFSFFVPQQHLVRKMMLWRWAFSWCLLYPCLYTNYPRFD